MEPPDERDKDSSTDISAEEQFFYRENSDGSIDSICLRCLLTVARAKQKWKLEPDEREHTCGRTVPWKIDSRQNDLSE